MSTKKALKKLEKEISTEESENQLPVLDPVFPPRELIAGMQVQMSAPGRYLDDEKREALAGSALELYFNLTRPNETDTWALNL